ncbi:MAG: toll/interleukin-1 receptor domain-containing protein [Hyphomonadaceae bacterium]|nr:toll/interleukin-1 receptor domain-containing protein [Hyphomonadaceae bacterium]
MADVFISYSRLDHDRVRPIVDRLGSLGYTTWWDKHLRAGQVFVDEIERQLDAARCVLTAWSHNARNSTWVYAESSRALDARKFLQFRLDTVQLPLPFDALQAADMTSDRGEWGQLEAQIAAIMRGGGAPPPLRNARAPGPLATPAAAGSTKLLTAASTATLAAYAGAVSATYNGVMAPEQLQVALTGMVGVAGACAALSAHRLFAINRAGG